MAYGQRYNYANRYNPRRNKYRRAYSKSKQLTRGQAYGAAMGQLVKDVSMLKGLLNTEFKYKDTSQNETVTNVASFYLLNGLSKGDDATNRDGRKVRFKSINIKHIWHINASATNTYVRALLLIDKQAQGAAPTITEVFQGNAVAGQRNLEWRKRFVILKDWFFRLDNASNQQKVINYYKQIDMKTIFDDSDTGTIQDINANSLYLMYLSDEPTNAPIVSGTCRLRFIDN